jgi:tRNA dimethylallyltransferase
MMAEGFFEEVEGLLKSGFDESLKPMQSLGYRHLSAVVRGSMPLTEAVALIKRDTRMYSKRQMTWFLADRDAVWLAPDSINEARRLIDRFWTGKGAL